LRLVLDCPPEAKDLLVAELLVAGTIGIEEEELPGGRFRLHAFFYREATPQRLSKQFVAYSPQLAEEPAHDWTTAWQAYWETRSVGRRFFVVPSWSDEATPAGRLRLVMHPGLAFGTGAHPTTQLCIEAMEDCVAPHHTVLDVGTGSGILCVAAALLGADRLIACDTDPIAVDVAAERLRAEALAPLVFLGSAQAVRSGCADVAVMNISAPAAVQLAPEVARALREDGAAVLSGFAEAETREVAAAAEAAGLRVVESRTQQDWSCLVCRKRGG